MSLKILLLLNRVPWPLKDGGAIGYYNYIKGYKEAGCDVTVAAFNTSKHFVEMDKLPDEIKKMADWHTCYINNDIKPVPAFLNLFSAQSYHVTRFISAAFRVMLRDLLNKKTFDVIISESLFMAPYVDDLRRYSNALIVLRQHNIEYRIWQTLAAKEGNFLKRCYLNLLAARLEKFERKVLSSFDALTAVTENDKQELQRMGCEKDIFVSPAGVDLKKFIDEEKVSFIPRSVFHIGSMEWMPNAQAMLWFINNVWSKVVAAFPDAVFYLAGRNMPKSFYSLANKNIMIEGEVDDAMSFMENKQIMVVPLLSGSGIRIKILEGMASGKTVVTTSLGAQGIECDNGRHLFIADTEQEFAEIIVRLLGDEELCSATGQNARKLIADKYNNKKIIELVLDFYQEQITQKNS